MPSEAKYAKTKYILCINNLWEEMKHIKPSDYFVSQPTSIQKKTHNHFNFSCVLKKHSIATKVFKDGNDGLKPAESKVAVVKKQN